MRDAREHKNESCSSEFNEVYLKFIDILCEELFSFCLLLDYWLDGNEGTNYVNNSGIYFVLD